MMVRIDDRQVGLQRLLSPRPSDPAVQCRVVAISVATELVFLGQISLPQRVNVTPADIVRSQDVNKPAACNHSEDVNILVFFCPWPFQDGSLSGT
jgi:hypothetical protein